MTHRRDEFREAPSSMARERLIVFTRYPAAGQTKTRLIPVLGAEGAARLQRRLTLRALRAAEALRSIHDIDLEIQFDGPDQSAMDHWLGDRFHFRPQVQGDLGNRMLLAFETSFQEGSRATVLIGADCPELSGNLLKEAFARLEEFPVVFGPATDGGYYLIGLRKHVPQLFSGLAWGTDTVLAGSLQILRNAGLQPSLLPPLSDIDRPEDLPLCQQLFDRQESDLSQLSVVIPALNEAAQIAAAVSAARQGNPREIIVVDAGSSDETVERACEAGAIVLRSRPSRARQMNAGASKATGNVLMFLHADTLLPRNYTSSVTKALSDPSIAAGAFRFSIGSDFPGRKLVEWGTNLRSSWAQMPYGDQALFLRRSIFEELGGFPDLPILEDYQLVRRLRRRGRIVTVPDLAITSARRWRQLGVVRTTLINQWIILGYRLGTPIDRLAANYKSCQKHASEHPPN